MKKSMKILLAVVLALALGGGMIFYAFAPALKLNAMLKEAYTTPDTDFTLMLTTPQNQLHAEGSRLTTAGQTEVKFLTPGEKQELLTRVVVDGKTVYLDFWPLMDVLGQAFFDFIEMENPVQEIPDSLRQSSYFALERGSDDEMRVQARAALLNVVKESLMPDLMDAAQVTRAEDTGVLVTWKRDKLAAVLTQAGDRLNAHDRELYVQWTDLMRGWGNELNSADSMVVRMLGKVVLGMARSREKEQAQGVAQLHADIAEQTAALVQQVQEYGAPELHVWRTDSGIAQRLKWNTAEGESRIFLELYPSTRTGVELPGQSTVPDKSDMT